MIVHEARVYPITDAKLSHLSHAEQIAHLSQGGATLVQFREKNLPSREFYDEAERALLTARDRGITLIINDRADVALALKADGVHLGQDDLPAEAARRLLGDHALIGISTHNLEQLHNAVHLPVNYIAIGPIFSTSSKNAAETPLGLEVLRQARAIAGDIPLIAIGGISEHNICKVREAGADAVAVISAVLSYSDIAARMKGLLSLC